MKKLCLLALLPVCMSMNMKAADEAKPAAAESDLLTALSNFDLKERDILKEVSEITHAPLVGAAMA